MARFSDHQKAIDLRNLGQSYNQIKANLRVSKSTLSRWLKDMPLEENRLRELRDWSEQRIEHYRETMRKKKEIRFMGFYEEQKETLLPFTKRDLLIGGLFLYWGEGLKMTETTLRLSNTDPAVIKFFIKWCKESLNVPAEKLRVNLHLYSDMQISIETDYWSKTLNIRKEQFVKPYIKQSSQYAINHKGAFGHGTCNVYIGDARMTQKVLAGIKVITKEIAQS